MEECFNEEKCMKPEELKIKQKEEETKFYQGKKASWWNFYYGHHGERDLFSKLRTLIENKLTGTDGKMLVQSVEVRHEPGAGGSILGRHLIWHFSQTRCISKPYRCCVVKQITENTVQEIENFRKYKDSRPRPVIILLDDQPDGNMFFQKGLYQLAYKTASRGELFGIVINVSRVSLANNPVEEAQNGKIVVKNTLKHRLTDREVQWFERKYKELEDADVDVSTLIAFNVMRKSFDKEYIKSTVDTIMEAIPQSDLDVLKILSLFGTYETSILVPISIFDSLVGFNLIQVKTRSKRGKVGEGTPFGIHGRRVTKFNQPPEIFNSHCLSLFACRAGYEMRNRGLRVISQPLAEIILQYIRNKHNLSLEDIVMFVLEHTQYHSLQENDESKRFVEVVCSLFKTREDTGKGKDGVKDKFSRLICAFLDQQIAQTLEDGRDSVVRVMEKCISITDNAFVGQQLARFFIIHKKDFDAGEQAICTSIALCQNNSYLLDTYGQVFKTKIEFIKETKCQRVNKMADEVANEVVDLAFRAMDKFIEGQVTTQEYEKDKCNLSCYHMEVRTLVGLLEMMEFFECYTNEEDLVNVLTNQKDVCVSFLSVLDENGRISEIINNGKRQLHADYALRFVEEREYQVKKVYTIYTEEDVLLLSLRERYERFYRSHGLKYQLKFGYGLKPLMRAYDAKDSKAKDLVEKRFRDAERNLQNHERLRSLEYADTRDLLFFLGFKFMELVRNDATLDANLYRRLLRYSSKLLDTQRQTDIKRPYLEAYLFYSIFHWPRRNRYEFTSLSSPSTYISMMEEWDKSYQKNNHITNHEQLKNNRGKNYFALSKDSLGVIDLYEIELEWREKKEKEEGRSRIHVYKDYFWREKFVVDRIKRLTGTLNDSGTIIRHIAKYPNGDFPFKIRAFNPSEELRNRKVTFVLGFTWCGLRAFDVIEDSEDFHSSGEEDKIQEVQERTINVTPREIDYSGYQRNSSTYENATKYMYHESRSHNESMLASKGIESSNAESQVVDIIHPKKLPHKTGGAMPETPELPSKIHIQSVQTEDVCHHSQTPQSMTQEPARNLRYEQIHKTDNTMTSCLSTGARPKSLHKSSFGESKSISSKKQQRISKRWAEPPSSTSLEHYPCLENVGSQAVKSEETRQHMDYASVVSKCTEQTYGAFETQSNLPSTSDYPVQYDCNPMPMRSQTQYRKPITFQDNLNRTSKASPQQSDNGQYWKQLQEDVEDFERPQADRNMLVSSEGIPTDGFSIGFQTGSKETQLGVTTVPPQGIDHLRQQLNTDTPETSGWKIEGPITDERKTKRKTAHKKVVEHDIDEWIE